MHCHILFAWDRRSILFIQTMYLILKDFRKVAVKCLFILSSEQVHRHLDQHEVKYLQFAFRWMNNLLMREVPLRCTIRLWDTYQVSTFLNLHNSDNVFWTCQYVCVCFFLELFVLVSSENHHKRKSLQWSLPLRNIWCLQYSCPSKPSTWCHDNL